MKAQEGPQEEFLARAEDEILYGGAKGGGKSFGLLMAGIRFVENKNYKGIIFRRSYPQLSELIDRSKLYFSLPGLNGEWNGQQHRWTFPSGATLAFGSAHNEGDELSYQGHEYQFMGFDQLEEWIERMYLFLIGQNRSSDKTIPCFVRSTANPGGVGHLWIKKRFIDNKEPFKTYIQEFEINGKILSRSSAFIPATVYDNKILLDASPNYLTNLLQMPEDDRKALLEGDWNIFVGQYFKEWRDKIHIVEPFPIPDGWFKFRCLDFGRTAPFACYWGAVDYDGKVWIYQEYYQSGKNADENAKNVAELSKGETYLFTVADPSIFSKTGQEYTIAEILAQNGLACEPADNDRISGWALLHQRLTNKTIFFFPNCLNAIRTIPSLIHDQRHPEDINQLGEAHAGDAIRYGLKSLINSKPGPTVLQPTLEQEVKMEIKKEWELNKEQEEEEKMEFI